MDEYKEYAKKSTLSLVILLIISISIFLIFIYCFVPWISYWENISPGGAWNGGVSYRITVTRIGLMNRQSEYEMLDKSELKELRKLAKEIKKNEIDTSNKTGGEVLSIGGKRYKINENNKKAYNEIIKLLKERD